MRGVMGLSVSEAARFLGVSSATVRRWADAGELRATRTPGGQRRFALSELERFAVEAHQATPPEVQVQESPAGDEVEQGARMIHETLSLLSAGPTVAWSELGEDLQAVHLAAAGQLLAFRASM